MAANQDWNGAQPGGGFLQLLGTIYLIKLIRRRRRRRRALAEAASEPGRTGQAGTFTPGRDAW